MSDAFDSPEAVEAAFYLAFAEVDPQAMGRVWSEVHPVACVHPGGGFLVGRQAVLQSWMEILSGSHPPRLEKRLLGRIDAPGLRVHMVEERIQPGADPEAKASVVIATNVYARDAEGWHMTLHHASLPMMPSRDKDGERKLH